MKENLVCYLMPHPPIILKEIGKGEEKKLSQTRIACSKIGQEINEYHPETLIIITPHGPLFSDAIALSHEPTISGDLAQFSAPQVKMKKLIDLELTNEIMNIAQQEGILCVGTDQHLLQTYGRTYELDHGSLVPLSFIESEALLVHITYGMLSAVELYQFGLCIRQAIEKLNRKCVAIASGDLSHRLSTDGPYSFSEFGQVFDQTLMKHLEAGNVVDLFNMNETLIEEAGECGLRSLDILIGMMGRFTGELYSYEGPFGVGYGVMRFHLQEVYNYRSEIYETKQNRLFESRKHADRMVQLARQSITFFLEHHEFMPIPSDLPDEWENPAGVFVSLKKSGNLRGCIGTFLPTKATLAEEIIQNAVEAATEDPRFDPVRLKELDDISVSVDVLSPPTPAVKKELDPKKYGVIVTLGTKRGLLLPDLQGVDSVEEQLSIACEKAGFSPNRDYKIEKFTVIRHHEGDVNE